MCKVFLRLLFHAKSTLGAVELLNVLINKGELNNQTKGNLSVHRYDIFWTAENILLMIALY